MSTFLFPRIVGPEHDLFITSICMEQIEAFYFLMTAAYTIYMLPHIYILLCSTCSISNVNIIAVYCKRV